MSRSGKSSLHESEARERISKVKAQRSPLLNLTELGLQCLPDEIRELPWLTALFASFNSFSDLSLLCHLPHLERLDFRGNQIRDLSVLSGLRDVSYLDLAGNGILDIAPLRGLTNLQTLYLGENHLKDVTPLRAMSRLVSLRLAGNQISDIDGLSALKSLWDLDLSQNNVMDIQPLRGLSGLNKLDLTRNAVVDLSPLEPHTNLQELYFGKNQVRDLTPVAALIEKGLVIRRRNDSDTPPSENPLTTPPPEIVARGNAVISKYFAELRRQGSASIYEAKLLIVGEGGVGKTSLARKIQNAETPLPTEAESTMGIDVRCLALTGVVRDRTFLLNIWDFGGQEIYHSTHQFFLTHRSLYVLVDDTRKDAKNVHDEVFSYWLQVIELLGGGSPLIIVQNEKSDRSKQIDLKSMQARFSFIKDCVQTNLATGRGLDQVLRTLKHWLLRLQHIGETLPLQWIKIRKEMERLSRDNPHIPLSSYFEICALHGIPEKSRALDLSQYLNDLGAFLHFQDHEQLQNIVILQNSWATDAVYAILDDEHIKARAGFFTTDDLKRVWATERYRFHHPDLMALMEKFELSYKLIDQERPTWLAPQLLPIAPAETHQSEPDALVIRYEYDFMPRGILPRLIVRLNRYIVNPSTAWRSGFVLERQRTHALITETYARKELVVRVSGESPRDLMTIAAEEIDNINRTYKFLKVSKLIPCRCDLCRRAETPYFHEFDNLQERVHRGKSTAECKLSFDAVDVKALLEGVFVSSVGKRYEDISVFISYSHKDELYRERLQSHLAALKLTRHLDVWDDRRMGAGTEWAKEIHDRVRTADIVLFLVSADFLSSRAIWEHEIPVAIERNTRGDAIVIPIIVRPCDTQGLKFMELQALPRNGTPISSFKDPDVAYADIAAGIRERIGEKRRW